MKLDFNIFVLKNLTMDIFKKLSPNTVVVDPIVNNKSKTSKNISKKEKKIYENSSSFEISRSTIKLFLECERCFYLHCKFGIRRPQGLPHTLNQAVDSLLKKEFESFRVQEKPHPIFLENNLDFMPFDFSSIKLEYEDPILNLKISGKVDAVWINKKTNQLIIADYKATSKNEPISLDADWQKDFKRQVEVYQWLFRKRGYDVSNTAYFIYCNALKNTGQFNKELKFDVSLIPYVGNASWIEKTLSDIKKCLDRSKIPESSSSCKTCIYITTIQNISSNTDFSSFTLAREH